MTELVAAFKSWGEAGTGLSSLGSMWLDMVPEGTAFPFWRMNIVAGSTDNAMTTKYMEATVLQVSVFHTDDSTLATLIAAVNTRYDRASITGISGGTFLSCERQFNYLNYEGVSKDGSKVYHAASQFRCLVDKTR